MEGKQLERRIQTVCLLLLAAVAVAVVLYQLQTVLIPFTLAVFFAIALTPLVDLLVQRLRAPRIVAIVLTLLFGVVVLLLLALLVTLSMVQLNRSANMYGRNLEVLVVNLTDELKEAAQSPPLSYLNIDTESLDATTMIRELSTIPAEQVRNLLLGTGTAMLGLVSQGILVVIFMIFLLAGGAGRSGPVLGVRGELEASIKRYVATKFLLSAVTGILVGGMLWMLDIPLWLMFGLFTFLLNFVPNIGSVIATLLPLPIVLLSDDVSTVNAILAIVLPGALQFFIGYAIEPKLYGRSLDLHPIVILMSLIVWGMLWGIVGALLAVPITAVLKILFEKLDVTTPVARLLAGRIDGGTSP